MRKFTHIFIVCSLLLLFSAGLSQATMMAGGNNEQFSGKLHAVTKLSDRYKLRINNRIMFILISNDKHTKKLIKTAKSLIHKKVTVTYNKTNDFIISIYSSKKKTLY